MLFSRHACFSCVLWTNTYTHPYKPLDALLKEVKDEMPKLHNHFKNADVLTFSIRSFLLMVMHLFKRSLYFSRSFCCSSICRLRSQFACREENYLVKTFMRSQVCYSLLWKKNIMYFLHLLSPPIFSSDLTLNRSSILPSFFSRSRFLLLSIVASLTSVSSVCKKQKHALEFRLDIVKVKEELTYNLTS